MNAVVVGGGKMGLPLACVLAKNGASVTVCDASSNTVEKINAGICPFEEEGVGELLAENVSAGRLKATMETTQAVSAASFVIVIVPVLLTDENKADLSIIVSVAEAIANGLKPGTTVSFETTLPVGTTRSFIPILETGGLKAGTDFHLVFSPERVKSRSVLAHLTKIPKIVGGLTPACRKAGEEFYGKYLGAPVAGVGSLEASEFAKVGGMVYRDVSIALANELGWYAKQLGIDFREMIRVTNTDGEANLLTPGIGVGGHCTPVYPYFYINDAIDKAIPSRLAQLSRQINDAQPGECVAMLEQVIGNLSGQEVLIMGLGFRPGVKEHTMSPAFLVQGELARRGAKATLCDPMYTGEELRRLGFEPDSGKAVAAILVTNHEEFRALSPDWYKQHGITSIVDGRGALDAGELERANIRVLSIFGG
ncbi:MAG: nucleotide sugar dehydrogenase [Armatimonadota bacterium]